MSVGVKTLSDGSQRFDVAIYTKSRQRIYIGRYKDRKTAEQVNELHLQQLDPMANKLLKAAWTSTT